VALYPCYYHNYLLGEILASQLYYYITSNVSDIQSFTDDKKVGDYLKEKVFKPGSRYYWNEMIERATGEKLTAKYYGKQFVE
jgi:peptidyl-dipeptidase A